MFQEPTIAVARAAVIGGFVPASLGHNVRGAFVADKRSKTLHYRRANWIAEHPPHSLEEYVRQAHQKLKTVSERTVERGEGHFIRSLRPKARQAGGYFLHLTADTPGESASTIPKLLKDKAEAEVGIAAPPADAEYMDNDSFLFIRNDHVCYCSSGMRDPSIHYFLFSLFEAAGLGEAATQFTLDKIANAKKVSFIQAHGVKGIILDASLASASLEYGDRKAQPATLLNSVGKVLSSLLDEKDADKGKQDNLQVKIAITADGRIKDGKTLGFKKIQKLAKAVVENEEDGDSYTILTKDNQKITEGEIILRKTAEITCHGKSVKCERAWDALLEYFQDLSANHLLDK
jgi:hypothetical protein